jgi:hypothetical protein
MKGKAEPMQVYEILGLKELRPVYRLAVPVGK